MIKIKSPIYLSFKSPLACLDGDLKSGVSVADLILIMGLNPAKISKPGFFSQAHLYRVCGQSSWLLMMKTASWKANDEKQGRPMADF